MKTILPAKEEIAQLWGSPKPQDTKYRLMKYLIRVEVDDGILLHNCVTRQMVLLTHEEAAILSKLPVKPLEPMQELINGHFLVPDGFDEYRSVNQLRKIFQSRSADEVINHYVILPTTFCNAHCFYCYESDYPRVHMSEETGRKLIEFIDKHCQEKTVKLDWFGGEPLVGIQRIDQICQGLKDRGISFVSSMISNGYLFDETIVERAVDLWKLDHIQITLDGTEQVYNQVKAYANVRDNPFRRVLRNIDLLTANKVKVAIRLNLGFHNKEDIAVLIEDLGRRFAGNEYVSVYLNKLFNHQGYEPVHHSQDDMIELLEIIDEFTDRLKELNVSTSGQAIPSLRSGQCMADDPHAIEIQPDGGFCRCEHEDVNDSYGSIDRGIIKPEKVMKWKETIERSDYCPECCVFPFCYMLKRCMNADNPCDERLRSRILARHKNTLRSVYQKKQEVET